MVIGVSPDSVESHARFAAQQQLPFILLSDRGNQVRRRYGLGKKFGLLPDRVTFIIDQDGIVRARHAGVIDIPRHAHEALRVVRELAGPSAS